MLETAFSQLSPILLERYAALLRRETSDSRELASMHAAYLDYALLDARMPRPVLAYFGFHAAADEVSFSDPGALGDVVFVPQLLRDVLAIHDDIVDEDTEKFGRPPLPVVLSAPDGRGTGLTKRGRDLALFYGDFLVGVLLRVVARVRPADRAARIMRLIADTLYVNQRGQLSELLAGDRSLGETTVDDVLLIPEWKAAHYCYAFPFAVGAHLAGHPQHVVDAVSAVLLRIGTASQLVDDVTGAFPGVVDHDKDTLGELIHLRRTPLLVLLAQEDLPEEVGRLLAAAPPLTVCQAQDLRAALWDGPVPGAALRLCDALVDEITPQLAVLPVGAATRAYLDDLVRHRLVAGLDRLCASLARR